MVRDSFIFAFRLNLGTEWSPWLVFPGAYFVATFLSGSIVGLALKQLPEDGEPSQPGFDPKPGIIIGKCENIITVTCVLADNLTGLAIIFAAKSLVRDSSDSKRDDYYLCGTLVNLVWGLLVGFLAKALVIL